jgi:uncharacterized membrane protein HdeD (DUF308 family)
MILAWLGISVYALAIVFGVVVLAWPGISALALLYVIGAYAVAVGALCGGAFA